MDTEIEKREQVVVCIEVTTISEVGCVERKAVWLLYQVTLSANMAYVHLSFLCAATNLNKFFI